jgi:hypothetical protein
MTGPRSRRSTPRPLVFVLTVLLLLGHACELPALAEAVAHVHESAHHGSAHHTPDPHADEAAVACDALVGIRSSTGGSPELHPGVDAPGALPVARAVSSRAAAALPREPPGSLRRAPLFLLHASLLI